ncbi:DUF1735 and LamG domain-containing protein [Capnocytophaga catalasegens]|uniref:BT-3987-like N-terminal domain-containing protein n=1 Tax=Capnocytophaga catalasegens TaxID=1004260 RepID=A0AAV5ARK4_9FLAO|nr:DUF1735 and LamG domain-containing protein [Capnocytophaga catalasegens]GIZ16355.1 hypothetical protein RCZ03_23550 [Capnocytophaga catalasegens]GJM49119.1 hypothetical protein RCZ15_00950 [Capnocytophaga catalasegens]GJM53697.1 hypothetical protein RCZ16_20130 [Capnocytophaga catalasegens]
MKNLYIVAIIVLFAFSCEKLPNTDSNLNSGNPAYQVSFLENNKVADIKVKDAEGSAQDVEIKARIANPMDKDSYYLISIDDNTIKEYNKKNGVDYELLPTENYEMTYTYNGVSKTGTSFEIVVPKGQVVSAGKLSFKVKPMKDALGNDLPKSNNYAVAVRMAPVDNKVIQQADKETSIFLIRRSFKTKVAKINGRAFHMIYGQDTRSQSTGKSYAKDVKLEEWTMQYSIALTELRNNWGLMYENPRNSTQSKLWNTIQANGKFLMRYGASATLVFNTAKGESFNFKAAGSNPTADKWYHVTMTYKKVDGRPILNIYVNGELMFDSPSPIIVNDFPLVCFGNATTNGYIREIRFWSKALTQGQAAATQYFVKPDSDGLELYVPFDQQPWEEIDEMYEGSSMKKRVIKNASTNPNKKMPEKWYLHHNGSEFRYPTTSFDTEVEF